MMQSLGSKQRDVDDFDGGGADAVAPATGATSAVAGHEEPIKIVRCGGYKNAPVYLYSLIILKLNNKYPGKYF